MSHTKASARGCGKSRTEGGIYMETAMGPDGTPFEEFIIDPPIVADFGALGVSPRGVSLVPDDKGIYHVFDWVGSQHYPNVADFIEETRRLGPSRRLPRTLEFEKITPESRMVLIHARAHIDNASDFYRETPWECPKGHQEHGPSKNEMCAGLWWQDVEPTHLSRVEREAMEAAGIRAFTRTMPAFEYQAMTAPPDTLGLYRPAMFLALPITNLSVVKSSDDALQGSALDAVQRSGVSFSLDDE